MKKNNSFVDKYWLYILWGSFLLASLIALWSMWGNLPRFNHDNLAEFWLAAFDNLIKAGHLSPSMVKDFYFGYGSPLFVFYPPLFYYLAEVPRLLGVTLVVAIKLAAGFSFILAFFGMYTLVKELWGKWAGLLAGLIYLTMPYHFALIFTRGSYAENLAYAIFPWLWLMVYRIFRRPNYKDSILLAVLLALLIYTNLPSVIVATLLIGLLTIGLAIYFRRLPWRELGVGLGGGIGLSAAFWLPVATNIKLIQTDAFYVGGHYFAEHFMNLPQYLRIDLWDSNNYYQIGLIGAAVALTTLGFGIQKLLAKALRRDASSHWLFISLGILAVLVGLTLPVSEWLWHHIPGLTYMQFPFRLLGGISVVLAILSGFLIAKINSKQFSFILGAILIQTIFFGMPVRETLPDIYANDLVYTPIGDIATQINYLPQFDASKPSDKQDINRHTSEWGYALKGVNVDQIISEIWPIEQSFYTQPYEKSLNYSMPISDIVKTKAVITNFKDNVSGISFDYVSSRPELVVYHQIGFPGWQVSIDNQTTTWNLGDNQQIQFTAPEGKHKVEINFTYAPGTLTGRWIAMLTLLLLGLFYFVIGTKTHIRNQ